MIEHIYKKHRMRRVRKKIPKRYAGHHSNLIWTQTCVTRIKFLHTAFFLSQTLTWLKSHRMCKPTHRIVWAYFCCSGLQDVVDQLNIIDFLVTITGESPKLKQEYEKIYEYVTDLSCVHRFVIYEFFDVAYKRCLIHADAANYCDENIM